MIVTTIALIPICFTFASMLCRSIGSKWNMPMELAFDLCTLALYDIAIYADDSTSMKFAEGMHSTSQVPEHRALMLTQHSCLHMHICILFG